MTVQVVLRKRIPNLGTVGEMVTVANGYARNYLFPRGLAYPVTPDNLKRLEAEKKRVAREVQAEKDRCISLASELENRSFSIQMKATEEGHLYGSVDAAAVVAALGAENVNIAEKNVELSEPIKEVGIYEISIQIHPEVEAKTKILVVGEDVRDTPPEPEEAPES
ncbi:MAG: 50S ribosomal protein L9 [Planctomycetota bacterium]|jgi:large subunit ribosomal protein L9